MLKHKNVFKKPLIKHNNQFRGIILKINSTIRKSLPSIFRSKLILEILNEVWGANHPPILMPTFHTFRWFWKFYGRLFAQNYNLIRKFHSSKVCSSVCFVFFIIPFFSARHGRVCRTDLWHSNWICVFQYCW